MNIFLAIIVVASAYFGLYAGAYVVGYGFTTGSLQAKKDWAQKLIRKAERDMFEGFEEARRKIDEEFIANQKKKENENGME